MDLEGGAPVIGQLDQLRPGQLLLDPLVIKQKVFNPVDYKDK